MLIRDLPAALRRRWYVTIGGILLTIGICALAYTQFPPTYEAKASVVLLPPSTTIPQGGNPFLQLTDLKQAVDVMTRTFASQEAVEQVAANAPTGSFEVLPDYETSGPIIVITAGDTSPAAALSTLEIVKAMVPPKLEELQASLGIAPESQITSKVLFSDDQPTTVRRAQLRALIVAFAVGITISALTLAMVDSALLRRAARRTKSDLPDQRQGELQVKSTPGRSIDSEPQHPRRLGLNPSAKQSARMSQEPAGRPSR